MSMLQATQLSTPQRSSPESLVSQHDSVWEEHVRRSDAAGFWDSLSKITLTLASLEEYDRRIHKETDLLSLCSLATNVEHPRRQARQCLNRFARRGGPDLSHLRGFTDYYDRLHIPMASDEEIVPVNSLEARLVENGIYPPSHDYLDGTPEPVNLRRIRAELARGRTSMRQNPPGSEEYREFREELRRCDTEAAVMSKVIPMIIGNEGKEHLTQYNSRFNNLERFGPKMPSPQPDVYYGTHPSQIDQRVRDDLDHHIMPATNRNRPGASNFAMEVKGRTGNPGVCELQATHYGAYGARAMHKLQNFGAEEPKYDNQAYSLTASFQAGTGTLSVFATHPTAPKDGSDKPEYHTTLVREVAMRNSATEYKQGLKLYRNARDSAKRYRDQHVKHANQAAAQMPEPEPSNTATKRRQRRDEADTVEYDQAQHEAEKPAKRARRSPASTRDRQHQRRGGRPVDKARKQANKPTDNKV